jgi:Domain of unknown function (DUF4440)
MRALTMALLLSLNGFNVIAQSADELAILKLSQDKYNYMLQRDSIAFKNTLHPNLQYIHSSGKIDTKESLAATVTKGTTIYKILEIFDAQSRSFKNTIIITGKLHYSAESKGDVKTYDLLFTEVYVKFKKQWLLVSRHASKI